MTAHAHHDHPPLWELLAHALTQRRTVNARYHGHDRTLSPHALGWKNGRAKLLAYQSAGTTSHGRIPTDPRQRWRSLFIDEIEHATLTDKPWQTADNYTPHTNGIDHLEIHVDLK